MPDVRPTHVFLVPAVVHPEKFIGSCLEYFELLCSEIDRQTDREREIYSRHRSISSVV